MSSSWRCIHPEISYVLTEWRSCSDSWPRASWGSDSARWSACAPASMSNGLMTIAWSPSSYQLHAVVDRIHQEHVVVAICRYCPMDVLPQLKADRKPIARSQSRVDALGR